MTFLPIKIPSSFLSCGGFFLKASTLLQRGFMTRRTKFLQKHFEIKLIKLTHLDVKPKLSGPSPLLLLPCARLEGIEYFQAILKGKLRR